MKPIITAAVLFLATLIAAQCPTGTPPAFTSATSATFTELEAATFPVTASGDPAPTISESGALPQGITFTATGLQGTPASGTAKSYPLKFTATNGVGSPAVQNFVLTVAAASTSGGQWMPTAAPLSWAWWLSNVPPANNLPAQSVIDSDGVDTPASTVAAMHAQGKKWICYVDVGTWEPGRPDASKFPASVKGSSVDGFESEKWLDVRQQSILLPLMTARIKACQGKGADAVEPDDVDGYTNSPGFPFTAADQLSYNKAIAGIVHSFGMSVALKNDGDQVKALQPFFDFAIEEQCVQYGECNIYTPFTSANKAVFGAEYKGTASNVCKQLNAIGFDGILTNIDLTGKLTSCR